MNIIIIVCSWVLFASQVECNIPIFTHPSGGDQTTPPCAENMPVSTSVDSVTLADTTGFNVAIHSQTPPFPPFQMTFADINGTDGSADPRNTVLSIPLTLIIEDENDNFPQFLNDSYARIIYDSVIPVNPCISNPCANGGTCVVIGKSFKCICASGIQVPNCSITDPTTISSTKSQGDPCSSKPSNTVSLTTPHGKHNGSSKN
ncbi:hypothetical protein DPMN_187540 [Dreissena polymorpha]|uniref:EGF-like domain-containing protein n=1 Tax=Dreissena polymorpha TaxID=45954 RepID=A0A9D4DSB2_DREPO|nr:hypothetical protein DPMN_187540 [Dreissena polymorpha]